MFTGALAHDFDPPATLFGVQDVHAKKVASKEGGFVATSAGPDFKKDIPLIVGVLGNQQFA